MRTTPSFWHTAPQTTANSASRGNACLVSTLRASSWTGTTVIRSGLKADAIVLQARRPATPAAVPHIHAPSPASHLPYRPARLPRAHTLRNLPAPSCACLGGAFDLSAVETAVIIGTGNVALDCARILTKDPDAFASDSDICERALEELRSSALRQVVILGRRGVLQAAFTIKVRASRHGFCPPRVLTAQRICGTHTHWVGAA